jgi:acyl-CoA thioesterase FadM
MRVRWAEVDKQGIVFNGHYVQWRLPVPSLK